MLDAICFDEKDSLSSGRHVGIHHCMMIFQLVLSAATSADHAHRQIRDISIVASISHSMMSCSVFDDVIRFM